MLGLASAGWKLLRATCSGSAPSNLCQARESEPTFGARCAMYPKCRVRRTASNGWSAPKGAWSKALGMLDDEFKLATLEIAAWYQMPAEQASSVEASGIPVAMDRSSIGQTYRP
jgi:hypothetical protein